MKSIQAARVSFLVDAAAYYHAFVEAAELAQESILILGWDIHSELELIRSDAHSDGSSKKETVRLARFLDNLLRDKPNLHIHILCWDFAVIYALEREKLTALKMNWLHHERLHFALDNTVPSGASHHQKVVVIDDSVAFVGGIDLTVNRWDTPDHEPHSERRNKPDGEAYAPFHDIQVMVNGPIAGKLGALARSRWERSQSERLPTPSMPADFASNWPDCIQCHAEKVPVGVVVTMPEYKQQREIRETEAFLLRVIESAQRFIYIESQYFTSPVICDALMNQLDRKDGPEIFILNPAQPSGWLEQVSMGVLRSRLLQKLKAKESGRLCVAYPVHDDVNIYVHSKLVIADDRMMYAGSANLSNRSMGFDTECGLAFDARGDSNEDDSSEQGRLQSAIRDLRQRLLSEHLGVSYESIQELEQQGTGLVALIQDLGFEGPRRLRELDIRLPEWLDQLVPDGSVIDPERPIGLDEMVGRLFQ
ncbi:MAG: hypothetical protein KDK30_02610 [Leptospiraceae bacterium]|nr:hypothetical protein [Leptospiraceae bacterium]MCB1322691.1 hypothetical protein [Leptospiraceae bacterium]